MYFCEKFFKMSKRSSRVSILEKEIDNQPVIMTEFAYKTLTMVTKSIGWFTRRTSQTYNRTSGVMETEFGQPEVSLPYPRCRRWRVITLCPALRLKVYSFYRSYVNGKGCCVS